MNEPITLAPYQRFGANWLGERSRGYLADDAGLGKTIQVVTAANEHPDINSVLCIAPASVLSQWDEQPWRAGLDVQTQSYTKIAMDPSAYRGRDLVILDEAHYVKSPSAARTKGALKLAREAPIAWPVSATPMPNDPRELWPVMIALWPELLEKHKVANWRRWRDTFVRWKQGRFGPVVTGVKNVDLLHKILSETMLRRTELDVDLQLPELRLHLQLFDMPEWHAKAFAFDFDEQDPSPEARRMLGAMKAPHIAAVVREELENNAYEKLVLFAYHHDTLDVFTEELRDLGVTGFTGKTTRLARDLAKQQFANDPDFRIMLLQQDAGGVGLNLQAATQVVLAEPSWVPGDNWQYIKRIHRRGQTRPCRARMFAARGTPDETVMRSLRRKTYNLLLSYGEE